jgi:hypothetical protein
MKQDQCRSCKAPIIWARTEKGRRIPLDAKPTAGGNLLLERREYLEPLAVYKSPDERAAMNNTQFFISHFATCNDSAKWRKK